MVIMTYTHTSGYAHAWYDGGKGSSRGNVLQVTSSLAGSADLM